LKPCGQASTKLKLPETFSKNIEIFVMLSLSRGLLDRGRLDNNPKEQLNLNRLRARMREKPRTKAGQVRQAWPEIKDLFVAGHSLKDIWKWFNEIGIEIGYPRLSDYVSQMRRREAAGAQLPLGAKPAEANEPTKHTLRPLPPLIKRRRGKSDPLANVLEREQQRPGFNYNSEPDLKKLI
jgi:hypothetical protein